MKHVNNKIRNHAFAALYFSEPWETPSGFHRFSKDISHYTMVCVMFCIHKYSYTPSLILWNIISTIIIDIKTETFKKMSAGESNCFCLRRVKSTKLERLRQTEFPIFSHFIGYVVRYLFSAAGSYMSQPIGKGVLSYFSELWRKQ